MRPHVSFFFLIKNSFAILLLLLLSCCSGQFELTTFTLPDPGSASLQLFGHHISAHFPEDGTPTLLVAAELPPTGGGTIINGNIINYLINPQDNIPSMTFGFAQDSGIGETRLGYGLARLPNGTGIAAVNALANTQIIVLPEFLGGLSPIPDPSPLIEEIVLSLTVDIDSTDLGTGIPTIIRGDAANDLVQVTTPSNLFVLNGTDFCSQSCSFGAAVSVDSDILAVGAPDFGGGQGVVFFFRISDAVDFTAPILLGNITGNGDRFGTDLFLLQNRLAVVVGNFQNMMNPIYLVYQISIVNDQLQQPSSALATFTGAQILSRPATQCAISGYTNSTLVHFLSCVDNDMPGLFPQFSLITLNFCGDGVIEPGFGEQCDTGGVPIEGCGNDCLQESGFVCQGMPTTACNTICGDDILAGNEQCEPELAAFSEICDSQCQLISDSSSSGISDGAVAGIAIAIAIFCLFVICCVAVGSYYIVKKRSSEHIIKTRSFLEENGIDILPNIKVEERIGGGQFGEVYKGVYQDRQVALKTFKGEDIEGFKHELKIMSILTHPNILQFFGIYISEDECYMVTEFMEEGDLLSLLHSQADLEQNDFGFFSKECAKGMEYIHYKGLLHRDLACRNLLVTKGSSGYNIKVADFGLSREVENYYESEAKTLPVRWTAPEVIEFNKATKASDVWAFGIVMWEIFSRGAIPYAGWGNKKVLDQVKGGYRLETPKEASESYGKIMHSCWELSPSDRPSFEQIVSQLKTFDIRSSSIIQTATPKYSGPSPHISSAPNEGSSTYIVSANLNQTPLDIGASIDTTQVAILSESTYHTKEDIQ